MILNTVQSDYLGELICLGDNNGKPKMWAKKISLKNMTELFVGFNLYFYDVNFNVFSMFQKKGIDLQKRLKKVYEQCLNDLDSIDIFVKQLLPEFIEENENIYNLDDFQFSDNMIEEIRIYSDSYAVIMNFLGIKEKIGFERHNLFEKDEWSNLNFETEISPVEMSYDKVDPTLL